MYRIISALLVLPLLPACVFNHPSPDAGPLARDVIVVVGDGEVLGKPDVARIQLGVEARARDAAAAVAAVNDKAARMIEVLKQMGIAADDLQTRDFNIHSERYEEEPGPMPLEEPAAPEPAAAANTPQVAPEPATAQKGAGLTRVEDPPLPRKPPPPSLVYRASNTVHVTVRDLAKLGEVLSRAVEAGANQAWGISFEIDDDEPLVEKARAQAVADARAQAAELAKLAGVTLGPVVSISEAGDAGGGVYAPRAAGGFAMEMSRVPTESGQLAVHRQVQVVFAIEPAK